ncbi:hypothetical protein OIU35_31625 [Boseaceae bacterium BT-24-1]|nr:hypothetical protein [Boseaceae bacterium BT-24-1]
MSNVSTIKVAESPVNESALELVEETMARVKTGEVIAVAIIEVRKARTVATSISTSSAYHELNSGAARLAARLATDPED